MIHCCSSDFISKQKEHPRTAGSLRKNLYDSLMVWSWLHFQKSKWLTEQNDIQMVHWEKFPRSDQRLLTLLLLGVIKSTVVSTTLGAVLTIVTSKLIFRTFLFFVGCFQNTCRNRSMCIPLLREKYSNSNVMLPLVNGLAEISNLRIGLISPFRFRLPKEAKMKHDDVETSGGNQACYEA